MREQSITLAEAKAQGWDVIAFYCEADPLLGAGRRGGQGCDHESDAPIDEVIARLGGERRLHEIRARCRACGRDKVDVRPAYSAGSIGAGGKLARL